MTGDVLRGPGPGGYDEGYDACPCFWGTEPGRLVRELATTVDLAGAKVLDVGCGEGKNATYLASLGARVEAWDISASALRNATNAWPESGVSWRQRSVLDLDVKHDSFDLIVAYGLLHCLPEWDLKRAARLIQEATRPGGINILVAFNGRRPLSSEAHPNFYPTLVDHRSYELMYVGWDILSSSDEDLTEAHPHNSIDHTHSMTRIIARRR